MSTRWFQFERLDEVIEFVDHAKQQWTDGLGVCYLRRGDGDAGATVGTTDFSPEWQARRVGSDIGLAKDWWGREYAAGEASVMVKLPF